MAFSPDSKLYAVAAGDPEHRVRVWDVAGDKEVGTIKGYPGVVRSLAFSANGSRLMTGMDDGTVLVWDWKLTKQ